jgi:Domain of unknown function (DUF1995)
MVELPNTLDDAIAQSKAATLAAIAAGYTRLQVELVFPELKPMPIAEQFIPALSDYGAGLKVFFTDAGTAALAKRNWGDVPFKFGSLDVAGSRQTTPVDEQVQPDDEIFLVVSPSSVEVLPVEQICNAAGERPVILLNPRLEDVSIVGIGYAGRQLRQRFLDTIEPCYYLRPLDDETALMRCYPSPWQLWYATDGTYNMVAEAPEKPDSEKIDAMLSPILGTQSSRGGIFASLQQFLRALAR